MIVQFTDATKTKISSVLCGHQEGWPNLGELEPSDPRYVDFTKKMFLLTQPKAE